MGSRIVPQPDGRFAVFSTIVDDFIFINATDEELVEHFANEAAERARTDARESIAAIRRGETGGLHRGLSTMPFDSAVREVKDRHGSKAESLRLIGRPSERATLC